MLLNDFLEKIKTTPEAVTFAETINVIDMNYAFTPTSFKNGELHNEAGQNSGSCKLFSFASLHQLTQEQTLHCFGDYYREDVLKHPEGSDHQNIRNFISHSWSGVEFSGNALTPNTNN